MTTLTDELIAKAILEPNILIGQKPIGKVEINWSHPLAQKLKTFYVLNGGGGAIDLVSGCAIDNITGALHTTPNERGLYLVGNGTNRGYQTLPNNTPSSFPFTIAACGYRDTLGAIQTLYSFGGNSASSGALCRLIFDSTNQFKYQVRIANGGALAQISGGTANTYTCHTLMGVSYSAASHKLYHDAGAGTSSTNIGSTFNLVYSSLMDAYRGAGGWSGQELSGGLRWAGSWDRALTDQEYEQLRKNPYQLLKPANDFSVFIDTGAGVTFQPAWAQNATIAQPMQGFS